MVRKHSTQYLIRTHKSELKLLEMVKEAVAIDERIRNALWQGAMQNEMELEKSHIPNHTLG